MRYLLIIAVLFFSTNPVEAKIKDAIESTCKIIIRREIPKEQQKPKGPQFKDSGGTGVVFSEDNDYLWILTAGHVVKHLPECKVYFYSGGYQQHPVKGVLHKCLLEEDKGLPSARIRDLAIVKVAKMGIRFKMPKPIPLAGENEEIPKTILNIGCPNVEWPSARLGHVEHVQDHFIWFSPEPEPGRSGSSILDGEGNKIYGIVIWRDGGPQKDEGVAFSLKGIKAHNLIKLPRSVGKVRP